MKITALIRTGFFSGTIFIAGCITMISDNPEEPQIPVSPETRQQPAVTELVSEPEVDNSLVEEANAAAGVETDAIVSSAAVYPTFFNWFGSKLTGSEQSVQRLSLMSSPHYRIPYTKCPTFPR